MPSSLGQRTVDANDEGGICRGSLLIGIEHALLTADSRKSIGVPLEFAKRAGKRDAAVAQRQLRRNSLCSVR
jgi:hypothetical protein